MKMHFLCLGINLKNIKYTIIRERNSYNLKTDSIREKLKGSVDSCQLDQIT